MEPSSNLTWSGAKQVANQAIFKQTGKYINDIETVVLQASWEGKTYEEMAEASGYTSDYLNKDVGNKLWKKLSDGLGERVTKKNLRQPLIRASDRLRSRNLPTVNQAQTDIPFPEGLVGLDSPFYVDRNGSELLCYDAIAKPGALIRIKAPKLMGKTSLMTRILAYGHHQQYRAVYLDLSGVEKGIISSLDKLLLWLCLMVGRQLKASNRLHDYWDTEILGSNDNCTVYFEEYLLPAIKCPLVLGIDGIERIFPYRDVAEDFFGMLRSWHEKGKTSTVWQQLRIVLAHSTECYITLDMNQSPFNAGIPIELPEFSSEQVFGLAQLHGLKDWQLAQTEDLMELVGGHPYLVRRALYEIYREHLTLSELLASAATEAGIYSDHLRRHLAVLKKTTGLAQSLQTVVNSSQPVELSSLQIYKLHSMGLIERQDNRATTRCRLYREYFARVLAEV
ncbi:MAG: AAA-like domain-containing protein [Cyanobacteria bacterium P01_H01_bin.15]